MNRVHVYPLAVLFVVSMSAIAAHSLEGRQDAKKPGAASEEKQFDFWLGQWELSWPAEQMGGEAGEVHHGTNTVTKILDDRVIQETFRFQAGSFNGHSVSVFNPSKRIWQQTWVDNQGSYLLFDEFSDRQHELRAFEEFLHESGFRFEFVAGDRALARVAFVRNG